MNLEHIPAGKEPPIDINVIIEIARNAAPIKYEIEKDSGALWVDRFMATPMHYPQNYGFIPHTLAGDGDPVDVLVMSPFPLPPGSVIRSRPIGILTMTDEGGEDAKVLAVPHSKLTTAYDGIKTYHDCDTLVLDQITHFFENYKALEPSKWVKVGAWLGLEEAHKEISEGIKNAAK